MHALFEQVEWLETWRASGEDDVTTLEGVVGRTQPRRGATWRRRMVETFRAALDRDAVLETLSLGDRDPARLRVWRERPFVRVVPGSRDMPREVGGVSIQALSKVVAAVA